MFQFIALPEMREDEVGPDAARWDPVEGWSAVNYRNERVDDPFMQFGTHQ